MPAGWKYQNTRQRLRCKLGGSGLEIKDNRYVIWTKKVIVFSWFLCSPWMHDRGHLVYYPSTIFRLPIGGTCWAHCCDNLHDGTCTILNINRNNHSINLDEKTKKKPKKEAGWRKTRMGVKCERELAKKGLKWQESYSTSPHPLSWSVVAAISAGLCGKHTLSKAPNLQDCLWDKITPRQIIWTKLLHSWFSNKFYSASSSCHRFEPQSLLTSRENSTLSI